MTRHKLRQSPSLVLPAGRQVASAAGRKIVHVKKVLRFAIIREEIGKSEETGIAGGSTSTYSKYRDGTLSPLIRL